MATRHPDGRSAGLFLIVPKSRARILPSIFSITAKPVPRREGSMARTRKKPPMLRAPCPPRKARRRTSVQRVWQDPERQSHDGEQSDAEGYISCLQAEARAL